MFYKNNSSTLHTELEIIDKDFSTIDEKEYISIKEKIDDVLKGKYKAELEKLKTK